MTDEWLKDNPGAVSYLIFGGLLDISKPEVKRQLWRLFGHPTYRNWGIPNG